MDLQRIGEAIVAAQSQGARIGQLELVSDLHVGDAGTFECQVEEKVEKGPWEVFQSERPLTMATALKDASVKSWESAGTVIIDCAAGAFIADGAIAELVDIGEDFALGTVDDALFGSDEGHAVVATPAGNHIFVFRLPGDGTYGVIKGLDERGKIVCLGLVIDSE